MVTIGAAIIGFLVGLIFCYWKQLKTIYDNRDTIGQVNKVAEGGAALKELWEKI